MIQFIRILWGDFERYKSQIIEARKDELDEVVYVWGQQNYDSLTSLGYKCILISAEAYDYSIADAHTFENYNSLTHKIWGIGRALQDFKEIIFVDWDVRKVKPIDQRFFDDIRQKNQKLQVPLYVYPYFAFPEMLKNTAADAKMSSYLTKLEEYVKIYSYKTEYGYVLPNTGFFYCGDVGVINKMLDLITELNLQAVPDEFSVFAWANNSIEEYINEYEPLGIGSKEHGDFNWNKIEDDLHDFKLNYTNKNVYFKHL